MIKRALMVSLMFAAAALATSPVAAVAASRDDARALYESVLRATPGGDRKAAEKAAREALHTLRYLWSDEEDPKELEKQLVAHQLHWNFLSREKPFARLAKVRPGLWRIDLSELEMDPGYLEAARFIDPFFHIQEEFNESKTFDFYWPGGVDTAPGEGRGKNFAKKTYAITFPAGKPVPLAAPHLASAGIKELRDLLYTEVPILHAPWFMAQSARQISPANEETGLGYFDALGIKNRDDYFNLLGFSKEVSKRIKQDLLAIQEISKVSPGQRVIGKLRGPTGEAFVALDFSKPRRDGTPLKDVRAGAVKPDIEEWYIPGRNGLPYTGIFNGDGGRVNNAPGDAVGFGDDSRLNSGRDFRIHIHIACLRCHAEKVLLPVDDWMKATFRDETHVGTPDKKEIQRLKRQYFEDMTEDMEAARLAYQRAFKRATVTDAYPAGAETADAIEWYAKAYHDYIDRPVTPAKAARELGVPEGTLTAALAWAKKSGKGLDMQLAPLLAEPARPIHRQTWERAMPKAHTYVNGLLPLADDEKRRRK